MLNYKIVGIILGILVIILTIIHSQLFSSLGISNLIVEGNYEFTKVMLFNIVTPLLYLLIFLVGLFGKFKINIPKNIIFSLIFFYIILFISTYNSAIQLQSVFGGVDKGHGFIFYNNLILFFVSIDLLFQNIGSKYILKSILLSTVLLSIVGIKEYYFPSFDYGDLGNRLLSTLGHPNYVSAVLLMVIPYSISLINNENIKIKLFYIFVSILLLFTLILTKSFIAIFLVILYFSYILLGKNNIKLFTIITALIIISGGVLILKYFPEKLNSFISRFYIWETTLKIIFSDIKIFFFGIGSENLTLYFDNFKSIELYIYENIGFNADRPHNILLNFWIHFGIFGFVFMSGIYYKIIKSVNHTEWWSYSLLGVSIFWLFNFPNIIGYLFFIIIFTYSLLKNNVINKNNLSENRTVNHDIVVKIFIGLLSIFSIFGSYYSYKLYIAETLVKQDKYSDALETFPYYSDYYYNNYRIKEGLKVENNFYSEKYYLYNIYFSFEKIEACKTLVLNYPSIENYFYCGQLVENKFGLENAKYFYRIGINKMPDIWNKDSIYLNNIPSKYIINPDRILHSKYSNIQEILEKLNIIY